jgi:hypothetical protein
MLEWSVLPAFDTWPRLRYGSGSGCGSQRKWRTALALMRNQRKWTDGFKSGGGPKENERLRTQDWIQKKMNGRLRTLRRIRRKWTAPDPDWRIRRSNDTEAGLLVSFALKRSASYLLHWSEVPHIFCIEAKCLISFALKRSASYLLHSEIGSRASSKKRFYLLESQQFRIFSRNRSLLIRTKNRAT